MEIGLGLGFRVLIVICRGGFNELLFIWIALSLVQAFVHFEYKHYYYAAANGKDGSFPNISFPTFLHHESTNRETTTFLFSSLTLPHQLLDYWTLPNASAQNMVDL